jgi:hypothetical protein
VPLLKRFKGAEPRFVTEALRRVLPVAVSLTSNISDRLLSAIAVELAKATKDAMERCVKNLIFKGGGGHRRTERVSCEERWKEDIRIKRPRTQ